MPTPMPVPMPIPVPPPEPATPTAETLTEATAGETMPRSRSRNGMKVAYVHVVIGYEMADRSVKEVIHEVEAGDFVIDEVEHKEVAKKAACREKGALVGFEPTGEHELTVKVKYHSQG